MALNFSHRPIFPAHTSDDNLVSPMRIANGYLVEGIPENKGEDFVSSGDVNEQLNDCFDYKSNAVDWCSSSNDIIDLLPSDPFGMDISTTVTWWLENLDLNNPGSSKDDYGFFAGFDLILSSSVFQSFPSSELFDDIDYQIDEEIHVDESLGSEGVEDIKEDGGAPPHDALFFALNYLGVRDLLAVEGVCSSLRDAVRNDPLLWRSFHVDQMLNTKINNDALVRLTNRAQGNLDCLSLETCIGITSVGLKAVLESNPKLTKLCVSGSTRITIKGISECLKAFKPDKKKGQGLQKLRIGGIYGITPDLYEEFKQYVPENPFTNDSYAPHFYRWHSPYLSCNDDRAFDVEPCPICLKLTLVYDCPMESCCRDKDLNRRLCRGCTLCIPRCAECGKCISSDSEYEETIWLELVCMDCFEQEQWFPLPEAG